MPPEGRPRNRLSFIFPDEWSNPAVERLDTEPGLCYSGSMERQVLPQGTELGYRKDRAGHFWAKKAWIDAYLSVLETENANLRRENTAFISQVQELEWQIEALKARVLKLTQQVYGRKLEQQPPPKDEASGDKSTVIQGKRPRGQQKGAKGHGRRQYAELPGRILTP